ncbi:ABC transporter permease [Allofustis seminis]|uniref:ABC transporter permease n=1 Tax=Allofustis seminis TaxID=166939 RepID=UPI000379133B|nr:ABC transporter permease [Allofustis seminis]
MDVVTLLHLVVSNTLTYATPLIFTALAGTFSERSGVVNIGLEGIMVMGAFSSAVFNILMYPTLGTSTPWIGMLFGGLVGILFAVIHALATINFRADHIISGTVLNLAAPGLAVFLTRMIFNKGETGPIARTFGTGNIPLLHKIPFIGPILFSSILLPAYVGIALALISWFVLFKTRFGLRLRSVGEHPKAAESVGINVYFYKYSGVLISGFLGGMGGAVVAQAIQGNFGSATIAGQGFMAMAAMIFGKWNPVGAMWAALFFGFSQSLSAMSSVIPALQAIPPVFLQILPYILTIIILVGFIGKSESPHALGETYIKSE